MPVVPHSTAPLVSIPTGGTAAGQARQYDTRLGAPMHSGTDAVDAFDSTSSWRPLAQGLMDVAQAGASIGTKILRDQAEAQAMQAYAQYGAEVETYLYGSEDQQEEGQGNGLLSRRGADAFNAVADMAKFMKETEARLTKGLNSYGKQLFSERAMSLRAGVQGAVSRHEAEERRAARFNAVKASSARDFDLARKFPDNDRIWNDALGRIEENTMALIEINGMDPEAGAAYRTKTGSDLRFGRIDALTEAGNLDRAYTLLSDPNLSPTHRAKATAKLCDARLRELETQIQTDPQRIAPYLGDLKARQNNGGDPDMNAAIAASPDSLLDAAHIDRLIQTCDRAASRQRKDAAYERLRGRTPEEVQALLASPEELGIPDMTPADGVEVMGRLTADQTRRAEQQQAEARAREKELLEAAWTAFQDNPATAYAMIAGSDQPDERKGPMLAGISSGATGKADDPAFTSKIISDIAAGRFENENDLQAAIFCGNMTKETAEQALRLHQLMQGPQGRLLRAAFARLAGLTSGMDPRFGATTLADAQTLLMQNVAGAETPADLAAMVGPNAAGDAVGRSFRTASANTGLNAGTLYADAGGGMITDAGGDGIPGEYLTAARSNNSRSGGQKAAPEQMQAPAQKQAPKKLSVVEEALEPVYQKFAASPPESRTFNALREELQTALNAIPGLSPEEKEREYQRILAARQKDYANWNEQMRVAKQKHYSNEQKALLTSLEQRALNEGEMFTVVDGFMNETYKNAYGYSTDTEWRERHVPDRQYYPKRAEILGHGTTAQAERLLRTPETAAKLRSELQRLDPPIKEESWKEGLPGDPKTSRAGLSAEVLATAKTYAEKYNVPLVLALGVLSAESDGDPNAGSRTGVRGYMQTTKTLIDELNARYPESKGLSRNDPEQSIELGVLGLKMCLDQTDGDWVKALICYNFGPIAFKRHVKSLLDDPRIMDKLRNGDIPEEFTKISAMTPEKRTYAPKVVSIIRRHQPDIDLPKASAWSYLPAEEKKRIMATGPR